MSNTKPSIINVEVAYATPARQQIISLSVTNGTTIKDAIAQSGINDIFPEIDLSQQAVGIFSKVKSPDTILEDGDRIEIYRGLIADPKESRRLRAEKKAK